MTCTTYQANCSTVDNCQPAGEPASQDRPTGLLARLVSTLGERLFHYRYVRAGLIERTLERQGDGRKVQR